MPTILPFSAPYLPQLQALVNAHLGAVVPGWALPEEYVAERLSRNPEETITDPWVAERRTLAAVYAGRLIGAAHLLRYGEQTLWRGRGEIDWLLFLPGEKEAGAALLAAAREQMQAWEVTTESAWGGGLPVPVCSGLPDVWLHLIQLFEEAGFAPDAESNEAVYGGELPTAPPGLPPVEGMGLRRRLGRFGARFSAVLNGEEIGRCECVTDLSKGGRLPALRDWAELTEVMIRPDWRGRGIGSWLVRHTAEWARLAGRSRLILTVAGDDEAAGAGRFYERFGWKPLARMQRGWRIGGTDEDW